MLQDAGIVSCRKDGRRVVFSLEGGALVGSLERILGEARALAPLCCPPSPARADEAPAPQIKASRAKR